MQLAVRHGSRGFVASMLHSRPSVLEQSSVGRRGGGCDRGRRRRDRRSRALGLGDGSGAASDEPRTGNDGEQQPAAERVGPGARGGGTNCHDRPGPRVGACRSAAKRLRNGGQPALARPTSARTSARRQPPLACLLQVRRHGMGVPHAREAPGRHSSNPQHAQRGKEPRERLEVVSVARVDDSGSPYRKRRNDRIDRRRGADLPQRNSRQLHHFVRRRLDEQTPPDRLAPVTATTPPLRHRDGPQAGHPPAAAQPGGVRTRSPRAPGRTSRAAISPTVPDGRTWN
jgi:hypothetical protein